MIQYYLRDDSCAAALLDLLTAAPMTLLSQPIVRITLQIEILLARRHPHVPDQHRRPLPLASIYRTMGLPAIGFWTGRCEIEGRPVGRSRSSDRFASNRGLL